MTLLGGRYELGAPIGSGGTADVIEAFDRQLQRPVAVKMLRTELADPRARERFAREARVAAGFMHPNAIHVYDVGEAGQRPYIVMERVNGRSLAEVIAERGRLAPDQAVDVADQVLAALEAAHRQGLVHRDVKPGNVMLTDDGGVKLTDFGIAKAISDSTSALTVTGLVMGTPRYLSPEQAAGQPADPRSDLYAVGVVLYEMLAGVPPFMADTPVAMALAHQQAPVPPLAGRRSGLPPKLVATVDRALEKDPARRFPDAAAMRAALAGDTVAALTGVTVPAAAVDGSTEVLPRTTGRSAPRRRRRGGRGWLIAAALLGLFLVAALVAWAIADRDDPNDPTAETTPETEETEPSTTQPPTTTLPPEPQTVEELIALLADDPDVFGQSGPELLDGLVDLAQGDAEEQAERAANLLGDLEEWVEDGELDPGIAGVARGLLIPIAAQGDDGSGGGNDGNDGNGNDGPPGGGNEGNGNGGGDD